jgi:hypothetical protein
MLNIDTRKVANSLSSKMMLNVSLITCVIQIISIVIGIEYTHLISTIFLVLGIIIGTLLIEKKLRKIFDSQGNRK